MRRSIHKASSTGRLLLGIFYWAPSPTFALLVLTLRLSCIHATIRILPCSGGWEVRGTCNAGVAVLQRRPVGTRLLAGGWRKRAWNAVPELPRSVITHLGIFDEVGCVKNIS